MVECEACSLVVIDLLEASTAPLSPRSPSSISSLDGNWLCDRASLKARPGTVLES